jgi:DNA-binding MarR family transcriptional regulator
VETAYVDLAKTIERLHRRFLDVVRAELTRLGYRDLTAVQAMLLTNIGDEEIVIRDLIERGYYQGSNVSYNMKKLVDGGYIEQQRAEHDKRSVRIKLTDKSRDICEKIKDLEARNANALVEEGLTTEEVEQVQRTLKRLERVWGDYIHYGPS